MIAFYYLIIHFDMDNEKPPSSPSQSNNISPELKKVIDMMQTTVPQIQQYPDPEELYHHLCQIRPEMSQVLAQVKYTQEINKKTPSLQETRKWRSRFLPETPKK